MEKKSIPSLFAKIVLVLFFCFCLFCCLEPSRLLIIHFMEKIIGRGLNDMVKWNAVIVGSMKFFASIKICAV